MTGSPALASTRPLAERRGCVRTSALWLVLSLVAALSAGLPRGRPAWGQDDWDAARQPVINQPGQRVVRERGVMMEMEDFDRWVTGGKTRLQIEHELESLLALQVDSVARTCGLSDAQRTKLELAGQGDVKRLSRNLDQIRERFRLIGQDQQKFNDIASEVAPLQVKIQTGVFGDSSLYRKILNQTLDPQQSARYEQQDLERRKFRYEAKIEQVLTELETAVPLRVEQRQRLVKLLLDETQPPRRSGQYDTYVVLYQMGKLGEAKLKPIFDGTQWKSLKRALDQSRGIERFLQKNGFVQ